ncbi:MAG: deoxyribonuclease V [Proteobacteria bacterium]|nr:deoxyribonuclease V [Pseudomonadota bacterium]
MKVKELHRWDIAPKEAVALQQRLRERLVFRELQKTPKLIAGVDVSYEKHGDLFHAAIVILSFPGLEVIEESCASGRVDFPYIPGLLSFREGPVVIEAFKELKTVPDLAIFDGQGIAHPRGIGIASHIGLFLDIPTIGCAKTRLVGEYNEPGIDKGEFATLVYHGLEVGTVLRTRKGVKPVFVSSGHLVTIEESRELVLGCSTKYRLPEATRRAHILSNKIRIESQSP